MMELLFAFLAIFSPCDSEDDGMCTRTETKTTKSGIVEMMTVNFEMQDPAPQSITIRVNR